METRQKTEVKIYSLVLNPMRGNTEGAVTVAASYDKERLIAWYKDQFAEEPYFSICDNYFPAKVDFSDNHIQGQRFHKVFKKNGPLEWFNPINLFDKDSMEGIGYGHGLHEQWIEEQTHLSAISRAGAFFVN